MRIHENNLMKKFVCMVGSEMLKNCTRKLKLPGYKQNKFKLKKLIESMLQRHAKVIKNHGYATHYKYDMLLMIYF